MRMFFDMEQMPNGMYMVSPQPNTFEACGLKFGMGELGGTYNALLPHILGMTYADYLRMMRDRFGGKLYGKKGYTYVKFDKDHRVQVRDFLYEVNNNLSMAYSMKEERK